jgi:hypothetical protein
MYGITRKPPPPLPPKKNKGRGPVLPSERSFQKNQGVGLFCTCAVTAMLTAGIVVAFDFYFGAGHPASSGRASGRGTLVQEGTVTLRHEPLEVFYPVPYGAPPNLSLIGTEFARKSCLILEQKQDHFKIHLDNPSVSFLEVSWRAEGVADPGK